MRNAIISILSLAVLVTINLAAWAYKNAPQDAKAWTDTIMGVAFSPMRRHHNPLKRIFPTREEIDQDLALLEGKVHAVRTYSSTDGYEAIPELAANYGLNVSVGAWIADDPVKNQKEIDNLITLTRLHNNVVRGIVGNETIMRGDVSVDEMIGYLRQVRSKAWRPISTSEPPHTWMTHPELADEVDFIAVHLLPYWDGIPMEEALDHVFSRYYELQRTFPDKPIVITEVGWPSDGQPIRRANASLDKQAKFLREFLNLANERDITYYIIEAFDQPWKIDWEGSSGAYWGIYDVDRQPKFPMEGKIQALPAWKLWASIAAGLGILLMLIFLATRHRLGLSGRLFFGVIANLSASTLAWSASVGAQQYQTPITGTFWVILLVMQALALMVLLVESLEISEVLWFKDRRREFQALTPTPDHSFPKVSLHLPIHNEPPEMVRQTLEALARLDYPNYEVLVVDNNTSDSNAWRPVQAACARLGSKFRFFQLQNWPGFKAGALNYALEQTSADAEIIGVIDSDYIVKPDWLQSLVPYFDRQEVGFVQAPQDYSDRHESWFKNFCHWEYAGFFRIGMVQRNEFNAIIQHGTMTLIRKSALNDVGNWGEWCICEDSELGLRLFREGYDSVYVKESFGRGMTPDTLSGYMTQRFRWVYGAMQILKRHWRAFLPGSQSDLTPAQRYYFVAGWLPWFSDGLAFLFTLASLFLTARVLIDPVHGELPVEVFIVPTIGLFGFKLIRSFWLYSARVKCSPLQILGAAIAGLALTHTVSKAILLGLFTSGRPFLRTPKCEKERPFIAGLTSIRQELLLLVLLWAGAFCTFNLEHFNNLIGNLWTTVLLVQSVPYAACVFTLLVNVAPNFKHWFSVPKAATPVQPSEHNA